MALPRSLAPCLVSTVWVGVFVLDGHCLHHLNAGRLNCRSSAEDSDRRHSVVAFATCDAVEAQNPLPDSKPQG